MLSNKQFFEQLEDGQEYLNCFMTKETHAKINPELRTLIAVNEVRQKNRSFEKDETHKELLKKSLKAKKDLTDYEFNKNHSC